MNNSGSPPKPTPGHLVIALAVIAICFFLISLALAMFLVRWDPCMCVAGSMVLPLPSCHLVQQYRGTFRFHRDAAKMSGGLLTLMGGFVFLSLAVTVSACFSNGLDVSLTMLAITLGLLMAFCIVAGYSNFSWSKQLYNTEPLSMTRISVNEMVVGVGVICVLTGLTSWLVRGTPPRYAENVTVAEAPFGLPPTATAICFGQGPRGILAYEFTVDEISFREWVNAEHVSQRDRPGASLEVIAGEESITSYKMFVPKPNGPGIVIVHAGLHYSWSFEDEGRYVIFDSETNRAYFYMHHH